MNNNDQTTQLEDLNRLLAEYQATMAEILERQNILAQLAQRMAEFDAIDAAKKTIDDEL